MPGPLRLSASLILRLDNINNFSGAPQVQHKSFLYPFPKTQWRHCRPAKSGVHIWKKFSPMRHLRRVYMRGCPWDLLNMTLQGSVRCTCLMLGITLLITHCPHQWWLFPWGSSPTLWKAFLQGLGAAWWGWWEENRGVETDLTSGSPCAKIAKSFQSHWIRHPAMTRASHPYD